MLRHKNIDKLCCVVLALTILLTCGYMGAAASGMITAERTMGYENRLFDQSRVHTIDIVMNDWESFIDNCVSEEYASCTVVIDGENFGNVAIRGKGNTSLSSVQAYGNDRYSFKVEFDHYQNGRTYHGLDKLSLNNLIQDKTFMKDYLAYTMMNKMDVSAPLCSFVQINVNGAPWGLYLAVEGVEDSFLERNYGKNYGELYKPDSMSFGGGRGNGKEFDMDSFREQFSESSETNEMPQMPGGMDPSAMFGGDFDFGQMPGGMPDFSQMEGGFNPFQMGGNVPFGMGGSEDKEMQAPEGAERSESQKNFSMPDFGGFGGMGSNDVKLQYSDDNPSSYSNIFNNAKTDITEVDQRRLINSLKELAETEDISGVVDVEAVIRYLVVHNFLCNDDSYTGMMVHNYYLYEENGVLSLVPWDYNLALGGFSMGGMGMGSGATSTVNSPIDSPVSSGDISSRPMISWIFEDESYLNRYHEIYAQFVEEMFDSGWLEQEINRVSEMIAPYVEVDENGFFSAEEFSTGVLALKEFCKLRGQSIAGQLEGTIPSTTSDQRANSAALVDASHIDLSDMGEFGMGGGNRGRADSGKGRFGRDALKAEVDSDEIPSEESASETSSNFPLNGFGGGWPAGDASGMPGQMPEFSMGDMSNFGMPPQGFAGGDSFAGGMPQFGGSQMEMPQGGMPQFGGSQMEMPQVEIPQEEIQVEVDAQKDAEATDETSEKEATMQNMFPGMPGMSPEFGGVQTGNTGSSIALLAGSVLLLIAALIFAKFYKVNR